jgi:hypothetical protein
MLYQKAVVKKIKICTIIDLLFNIIQDDFKLQNNVLLILDF